MDPTLTGEQVRNYILNGARVSRLNPSTGDSVAPPNIGISGIYQLDAYGALSLLSKERPGTPICGFQVYLEQPDSLGGSNVVLTRNSSNAEVIAVTSDSVGWLAAASVAQGGRLFAINKVTTDPLLVSAIEYSLSAGAWSPRPLTGISVRTYLEKDTVDGDMMNDYGWTRWKIRGSRWGPQGTTVNFITRLLGSPASPNSFAWYVEFAPDGGHAVVSTFESDNDACFDQTWLVPLPSGPSQSLVPCAADSPESMDAVWQRSGTRFITSIGQTLQAWTIVGGQAQAEGAPVSLTDRTTYEFPFRAEGHTTDPEGVTATWLELGSGCILTTRLASGNFPIVSEKQAVTLLDNWNRWQRNCHVPVQSFQASTLLRLGAGK